ncbi:MAG TPA: ribonuclease E/G [Caulobacteraceae bacterium]|nr:ribonuclease E/G [Caulobacteraceae bacterium]
MSERRAYLDIGVGETRGVVTLDGRPERLLIQRDGDAACQALGAVVVGRVRKLERQLALAFVELGEGPDGVLVLRPDMPRVGEGQWIEVEIRAEARGDKGAQLRLAGEAASPARVLKPAPDVAAELASLTKHPVKTGAEARAMADAAAAEALEQVFALPGGGSIAVERTRALTAVDVDVGQGAGGERAGGEAKRTTRAANLAALAAAARVLRLKGEGGLVVIDLAGRGHDGPALLAAARTAFGPDNPGVAFGPISRFGTLELTVPRRRRSVAARLLDAAGRPTPLTTALRLLRAIEREALADPGAQLRATAAPDVAAAAAPYLKALTDRFGARLSVAADPGRQAQAAGEAFEVKAG